jgi:pSer/pThr/pTyr-binding forkhead associated (FHA) protein
MHLTEMTLREKIDLNELPVIIGRDPTADIPLDDLTLPPFQCMIDEQADGVAVLWNLQNDFPLCVNGRLVTKANLLSGDILTIGQSRFVFSCEEVGIGFKCLGQPTRKVRSWQPFISRS